MVGCFIVFLHLSSTLANDFIYFTRVKFTEQGNWDTSKALVRRTLERCIQMGRQNRASKRKEDEYEAYRLLGQSVRLLTPYSTAHLYQIFYVLLL